MKPFTGNQYEQVRYEQCEHNLPHLSVWNNVIGTDGITQFTINSSISELFICILVISLFIIIITIINYNY